MMGIAAYDELGMTDIPMGPGWDPPDPRPPADAVILSDLHLGAENCQAKALVALLQDVLDGALPAARLIVNGDVFDSIDFRRLKKTHWKVLSQIRHLSDKIEVIWIAGNHDGSAEIVSHLLGVRVEEQVILTTGGRRLLVIHGHQFDDFLTDHPVLTWLADAGYWLLQKLDRSHYVARLAKRRSKTFVRATSKVRDGAIDLAEKHGCAAAVCGHTHHAAADEAGPVAYYNSGCWTEAAGTYLVVANGKVRLEAYAGVAAG
jgi:UDP-2,3-diacylglucosamine pyrophosphatase LpxH